MSSQGSKWLKSMVARYGSEEAVRQEMVRRQQKSMLNPNRQKGVHKGGYSYKSKEELQKYQRMSMESRLSKK